MKGNPDSEIWLYGKEYKCAIITTDRDYYHLALEKGAPPKIIWLKRWDYGTSQVEETLRRNAARISEFLNNEKPLLVLQRS
jgi:predicted nuclease of predicted toxin-antitoxin system